jgi:hypothetical protein
MHFCSLSAHEQLLPGGIVGVTFAAGLIAIVGRGVAVGIAVGFGTKVWMAGSVANGAGDCSVGFGMGVPYAGLDSVTAPVARINVQNRTIDAGVFTVPQWNPLSRTRALHYRSR